MPLLSLHYSQEKASQYFSNYVTINSRLCCGICDPCLSSQSYILTYCSLLSNMNILTLCCNSCPSSFLVWSSPDLLKLYPLHVPHPPITSFEGSCSSRALLLLNISLFYCLLCSLAPVGNFVLKASTPRSRCIAL